MNIIINIIITINNFILIKVILKRIAAQLYSCSGTAA